MKFDEQSLLEKRNGKPFNILIVDDEENVRNVFRDFCLSSPLFKVMMASGGQEAIELADKNQFDIVTMDLVMPRFPGCKRLRPLKSSNPIFRWLLLPAMQPII